MPSFQIIFTLSQKSIKLYYFTNIVAYELKKKSHKPPLHCYIHILRLFVELQNLIKDLKSELGGDLLKVILACMRPPAEFDARELSKAMEVRSLNHQNKNKKTRRVHGEKKRIRISFLTYCSILVLGFCYNQLVMCYNHSFSVDFLC